MSFFTRKRDELAAKGIDPGPVVGKERTEEVGSYSGPTRNTVAR